jgi:hypothetical protein
MTHNKQNGSAGFPILTILFLIFLTLKLAGIGVVATWSWWAVTSPLWGGALFIFTLCLFVFWAESKK